MRHFEVISILATLAWVGPVSAQQEVEDRTPAAESSQLDKLAHKAALRLAGFPAPEDGDSDESGSEPAEKSKIKLYYDENGMLLIDGLPDDIARFNYTYERILEKMRQVGPAKPDIRKYRCRYIDVSLAATTLDEIFNGPQRVRQQAAARQRAQQQRNQRGRQQQRGRQPEPEPEPEPESRGAPPGMELFESLFGGGSARVSDPTELMGIQVVPEKRTNYLFIMAKTDLFPQIIDTLHAIDVDVLKEERDSDIVVLQKLNADEVKTMLEDLLGITDARLSQQASAAARARRAAQQRRGRAGQQGQGAAQLAEQLAEETMQIGVGGQQFKLSDIKISSLAATNTIIVFGPEVARKAIVDIIKKLDDEGPYERMVSITLEYADAESIARALKESYSVGGRDGAKNIVITAETSSNTIYVTAPENVRGEIIERIMTAEANAMTAGIKPPKTIQILQGDAVSIAAILDTVFKDRGGGGKKITIVGEQTSNTLIVRAPKDTFDEIAILAAKMDQTPTPVVPKFYRLEHAYAPEVKDQVQDIVRQLVQSVNVTKGKMPNLGAFGVTADPATNSLIVMGTPVIFAIMDEVVAKVDTQPKDPTRRTTKTFPLVKTDAAEVARNINKVFAGPGGRKREGVDPPTAEPNISTNAVVVAGTLKQIEEIEKFIKDLEEIATPLPGGEIQDYTIALDYVDADQAAETLTLYFTGLNRVREETGMKVHDTEKSVSIIPDLIGKRLFVNATENNKKRIDEILASIDSEEARTKDVRTTRVFRLKYADPNNVANIINQAFRKRGRVPEKDEVRADVDWGTQSIVVTASDRNLAKIEEMIGALDEEGGQGKVVKIYEVKAARATELAGVLNQTLRESKKRTRQGQMPTSIVADEATNSLVITTTPAEYDKLLPTIERLDVERKANAGRFIKVYRVKYANLGSVWAAIDGAFNRGRGIKEEDRVSGSIDWETGTLIITANKDRHDEIEKMLAEIDTETAGGRKIHMVKMEFGDADAVAQALDQIIRSQKVQRGQSKPTITADAGTNTLIVYASESELASFQPVIESMDVEDSAASAPQRIELEHGNAAQLADLLTQFFTVPAQKEQRGRRGGTQKIVPLIMADDASNTLIVRAQQLDFDQIKDMVAMLDVPSDDGVGGIRMITVAQGIDVEDMAQKIERLIRDGERALRDQDRNYKPKTVVITADSRTNTLMVAGAPSQFDKVEEIIKRLEEKKPPGPTSFLVIGTGSMRANDVIKMLDQLTGKEDQRRRRR